MRRNWLYDSMAFRYWPRLSRSTPSEKCARPSSRVFWARRQAKVIMSRSFIFRMKAIRSSGARGSVSGFLCGVFRKPGSSMRCGCRMAVPSF